MAPSRRRALALGAALFSAGCAGASPASSETDTKRSASAGDECQSGVSVRARPFDAVSDLPLRLDEPERSLVAEAVAGEYVDRVTYAEAPLSADAFVARDDAFYRTDYTVANVEQIPAFPMDASWERGQEAPADAPAVAVESLPAGDREAFQAAVLNSEREELPERSLQIGEFPAPFPNGGDDSRLVGNVTWVRWRDRTFLIEVAGESEITQERRTFRYTTEQMAANADEFRRLVSDRYLFRLEIVDWVH